MRRLEGVGLRPISASDMPLLHRIYCSTRHDELLALDWTATEKAMFLQQQFELQHRYYRAHLPHAQFCILEFEGQDIGRWYLDRAGGELWLIDIALLPDWHRRGIGSQLLRRLMGEADESGRHILLHVEASNPALIWYGRLGFEQLANDGMYVKLSRRPCVAVAIEECQ